MSVATLSQRLHLRLFGSPSQSIAGDEVTGFRSAKTQALLYYLAVTGETHQRSSLAALFWPTASESRAANSLRNALSSLRRLLPGQLLVDRQSAALDAHRIWLDTEQFTLLLKNTDDLTLAMQQRQAAVSLYTGDFLDGFHVDDAPEFELWVTTQREHFQRTMIQVLMDLARWQTLHRDPTASLAALARLLTMAPGNEAAHRLMMQVLANTGQRAAAIQQFDACRRYLAEELGVDPEPETMALYMQLLEGARGEEATGELTTAAPVVHLPAVRGLARYRHVDPGDMPGRTPFHGRPRQLADLTSWLVNEQCTLVVISGIGGVGKTALAAELVHRLAGSFERQDGFTSIIWRSLVNAPTPNNLFGDWLQALLPSPVERIPEDLDAKLALLFGQLESQRVLLVLDNIESVMASGDHAGDFREGFDPYRQLLERMAHGHHQSCLLITTRVAPRGIRRLAADYPHVRQLSLAGLSPEQGVELLHERKVKGAPAALHALVAHYSGNPLALKLVASTVNDLYAGDVEAFLTDGALVFEDIRSVLDQQFARLSELARDLLVWLAVNREPVGFDELRQDLVASPSRRDFLEALRLLRRSSLLQDTASPEALVGAGDSEDSRLALHNVVMEYVTDRLLNTLQVELREKRPDYLYRFALLKASAQEYVQAVQKRLFLAPLAQWLVRQGGSAGARQRLRNLLDHARQDAALTHGYLGANVIHLMLQLALDLQDEDFSGLSLRQADLRSASLVGVDLRNTELDGARFADSFGIVSSVAVSPDSQFLAAGAGRSIVVWRLQNLQPYMAFEEHPTTISDVAFSPDGRRLASADFEGSLFLWDIAAGELLYRLKSHVGDLLSIAFSPDGETLVGGGYNGRIGLWNWRHGEVIGTLAPEERILRLAFAPTGELLANVGYYGKIQVWDLEARRIVYSITNENAVFVTHAALAVGHSHIWTHQGNTVLGWDRHNRTLNSILSGSKTWIDSLALSSDERQIASADANGDILLWDVQTGQPRRRLEGHQGSVRALTYTPDGRYLVSGGYDETVRIWDTLNGLEEKRLQGYSRWIYLLTFSPNGQYLAGVTLTGAIYFWDGHDLGLLHFRQGHKSAIRALMFSPDSRLFATGSDDNTINIWDVQSGELRHTLHGHERYVRLVVFDRSGRYLASSSYDNTIRLWDVATGRLLHTVAHSSGNTMEWIAFHPQRPLLAYTDTDNCIYLWDVQMGRTAVAIRTTSQPKMLAFSPDGRYLACGEYDGSVTLWAFAPDSPSVTLAEHCRMQPSAQSAWALVFSQNGSLLAWNGEQREIYVASIKDGETLCSIPGTHLAHCIAVSADGKHLLIDGAGFDVFAYDALTGEASRRLTGHTANLTSIVANPAAATMASSDAAGMVKLWDAASGEELAATRLSGPYLGMNITGASGLTQGQRQALLALGAVDVASELHPAL